ncbi:hypothetical protein RHSIM_Rhsim08G0165800 [Rhododendron simsii]|uniref:PGG domain-containing protein n=1 Tax=Rhododendron simsii TaxID=118357 RepID=A0A834LHY1_RHOSS|nr:hypothetical protein RHSIM_Rhsim08G0165800 [Rhododendron simsii]
MAQRMKAAAETGDINGLYESIKEDSNVLDSIDAIPFVDTPLHIAASAGHTDFAVEILRLKPSFGRKLNPDGLSSLRLALINHKFDTVKRLIKLDKELIRVKGKQGMTPLHFIARKEDSNADQQQRVPDDHHVNADIQQQNIALIDIARQPLAQSDVDRSPRALENSSCDDALAKFLNSPERCLEVLYKNKFFMGRSVTVELRNIGLVVAVLIATATFTSVLSPPGGVSGGDFNLLIDGGNFNATVTSTNNLFAANTSFFNATLSIPTDNPAERLLFDAKDWEYGEGFALFYGVNTSAFVLSVAMIMFVLPAIPIFLLLHLALFLR